MHRGGGVDVAIVPPDLVHAIVVASTVGDGDMIEIVVRDQSAHGVLATGRTAEDADARKVHPRAGLGRGFDPEDSVREASVADVLPTDIVEGFGSVGGAHAIDLDNDEAKLSHW